MPSLTAKQWFLLPHISTHKPIIIGGCGRSGTTLLRVILDTHSKIACGPESNLFLGPVELSPQGINSLSHNFNIPTKTIEKILSNSKSHSHFIEQFFTTYRKLQKKPIWAEKTPKNVYALPHIFRHFPKTSFIHVIRDGRDVICSLRHHLSHKVQNNNVIHTPNTIPFEICINRWIEDTTSGLKFRDHPNYYELRYEDLVTKPKPTLTNLLEFLNLDWESQLLNFFEIDTPSRQLTRMPQNKNSKKPIFTSSIGRWKKDLTKKQLDNILDHTSPLLTQLGYLP